MMTEHKWWLNTNSIMKNLFFLFDSYQTKMHTMMKLALFGLSCLPAALACKENHTLTWMWSVLFLNITWTATPIARPAASYVMSS